MGDIKFQDILTSNYKVMKAIEKKGLKDYAHYHKDLERMYDYRAKENSTLNSIFNLNKTGGKAMLWMSGAPAIAAGVVTALGAVGVALPLIPYIMASGEIGLTEEHIAVLKHLREFIDGASGFTINGLRSFATALVGPALFGSMAIPKTMLDEMKVKNGEVASDVLPYLDDLLVMIEDLKNGKEDLSLNFVRDFLSHVDISKNKPDFNLELLYRLSEYRVSILKENDGVLKEGASSEYFMDVIDYLDAADIDNGASVKFLTNQYVSSLLNTYAPASEEKNVVGPKR